MTRDARPGTGTMTAAEVQVPLLEAEAERELARLASDDPDVVALADYMLGALSPAQARLFERRLQSDEALASWAIPVLRARDLLAEERQRALDAGAGTSAQAWEQLQRRMLVESLDARPAAGDKRESDRRAPQTVARLATRVSLWAMVAVVAVIVVAFAMPYLYTFASGVASAATGGWRVTRGYGLGGAQLRLPNGGIVSGIGPTFIAVRKDGWLDPRGWGERRFDVYAHATRLTVASAATLGADMRLDTPRAIIVSGDAAYSVRDDDAGCAAQVSVARGHVLVASPMAPERTTPLGEGETIRIACDGAMSRGAAPAGGGR